MTGITTLPFKRRGQQNWRKAFDYTLPTKLVLEQWIVAAGTTVKLLTTGNFGFVCLPPGCMDCRGFEIPQRIFKY